MGAAPETPPLAFWACATASFLLPESSGELRGLFLY
jgi:hypothetical protein